MIETSLIDWDGKLTTVLFVDKCNFMCPFCQNWELLLNPEVFPAISWHDIEERIIKKKRWVDGVVLTGGEPLVYYEEIAEISSKIKTLGLRVKLDTNGAYPEKLQKLIDQDLIDYVALDIKAPFDETYSIAAGTNINVESIKRSAGILKNGNIDYEYRTTCVPTLINEESIETIGKSVKGARLWVLQQYVPTNAYKKEYRELPRVTESQIASLLMIARKFVTNVKWRGQTH